MHTDPDRPASRRGALYGAGAYAIWGGLPLFFRLLQQVPAAEILAHRIVWSLVLVLGILAVRGGMRGWWGTLRRIAVLRVMALSATLIAVNWLTYIWAVNHGHVVAASLGYFLTPLVNLLFGVALFGERLRRLQWLAVAVAATGVATLAIAASADLWISLVLAASFGGYGAVRKAAPVGSLDGLAIETLLLTPLMLGYLGWAAAQGTLAFGHDRGVDALLVFSAVMTSVPLLLFASAARMLPLSTLGLLQYIAPTLQFLSGVVLLGERLDLRALACFGLIWTGLAIFSADALRRRHARGSALPNGTAAAERT